jgi:hypothetical protein
MATISEHGLTFKLLLKYICSEVEPNGSITMESLTLSNNEEAGCYAFIVVILTIMFYFIYEYFNSGSRGGLAFISWKDLDDLESKNKGEVIVTDCTHPEVTWSLTHHRQTVTLPRVLRSDTSTGIMINGIRVRHKSLETAKFVSCNHFDVDGFCAVFAAMRPNVALAHGNILVRTAHIGDFRELDLKLPRLV